MKVLLTGINGQDGSHLADLLLSTGYEVHGIVRRPLTETFENLSHIRDKITLHQADMQDGVTLARLVKDIQPAEIYNFASVSFVPSSWDMPLITAETTALGVTRLLDAIVKFCPKARLYQASTSEQFGNAPAPQDEDTPMNPVSPYGVAKLYAHKLIQCYRQRYGIFACCGIAFNHEGPRRGKQFVTRKVCDAAAWAAANHSAHGTIDTGITLGTLDAQRDWGYAPDYVRAMTMMLAADEPKDYVIATGQSRSVRELVMCAYSRVGLDWREFVEYDHASERPNEINKLLGNASRIRQDLGWEPETGFVEMIDIMVKAAMEA